MSDFPDFRSPEFLRGRIHDTMAPCYPHCLDPAGGCLHYCKDDGTICDRSCRHTVSSARFAFDHAIVTRHFDDAEYLDGVRRCVAFIRAAHRNPTTGGDTWTLRDGRKVDDEKSPAGKTDYHNMGACCDVPTVSG